MAAKANGSGSLLGKWRDSDEFEDCGFCGGLCGVYPLHAYSLSSMLVLGGQNFREREKWCEKSQGPKVGGNVVRVVAGDLFWTPRLDRERTEAKTGLISREKMEEDNTEVSMRLKSKV